MCRGSDYVPAFDPVTEDLIEAIYDPGSIYFQPSMLERWEELDAAHSRMNSQPTGSLILLKADVLVHEIQVDMPEDYLSNARVHTFILMGALLFIFGVFAFFYSHLFHYGKDHKEVARNDTERYIKTV